MNEDCGTFCGAVNVVVSPVELRWYRHLSINTRRGICQTSKMNRFPYENFKCMTDGVRKKGGGGGGGGGGGVRFNRIRHVISPRNATEHGS